MPVTPEGRAMVVGTPDLAGQDAYRGGEVTSRRLVVSVTSLSPPRPHRVLTASVAVSEIVASLAEKNVTFITDKKSRF